MNVLAARAGIPSIFDRVRSIHWPLVFFLVAVTAIGCVLLYSAGGGSFKPWADKQIQRFGVAFALMMIAALTPLRVWFRLAYPVYFVSVGLLIMVEFFGRHGKGDKARVVFAGHATRQAIWRYLQDRMRRSQVSQLHRSKPLFCTSTGQHLDRSQLLHMIRNCAQRAGVAGANVHRFRHTFAVTMLRNGASAFVVQQLLGHEDMATVRVYIKLAEIDLEQAMRAASPADAWRL